MPGGYDPQDWTDGVSPRSAARFEHMEDGINRAHKKHDETVGAATSHEVEALEFTAQSSFTDLTTHGPEKTVEVSATGRLQVTIGAQLEVFDIAPAVGRGTASMSFELSGPTPVAPATGRALRLRTNNEDAAMQASRTLTVSGLAPGTYTVTAKYRQEGDCQARFGWRSLDVIPL